MDVDQHGGIDRPLSFRTADPDAAREEMVRAFVEHEMVVQAGGFDLRLDLVPSARLTLALLTYSAQVTLVGPPMGDHYHVNLPVTGASSVRQGGRHGTAVAGRSGVMVQPAAPLRVRWNRDNAQYALKVPKALVETHAERLAGRPPRGGLGFALEFDLTSGAGQALLATTRFLHAELHRPDGIACMPAALHELESAVLTQLVLTVPSRLAEHLRERPARTRRATVREVVEYIDAHPDLELSTPELAARVGISARALQAGFQEVVGRSPRAYVRGVRLDRVHHELATDAHPSVTEVAARWGFFHPGRFAQQYRERFGELPSETARR